MSNITITSAFTDIADAIRAKTGKSDTMTPAEMPTEIANISGGGGGDIKRTFISSDVKSQTIQGIQLNPWSSPFDIINPNGVTIISSNVDNNGTLDIYCSEAQAGYEGFNIAMNDLIIGKLYRLDFDTLFDGVAWWTNPDYWCGYDIGAVPANNYETQLNYNNLDRTTTQTSYSQNFVATNTTMYVRFNVCGMSDNQTNTFNLLNVKLYE